MASFCTHCGLPITESERFCAKCGAATGNPGPIPLAASKPEAAIDSAAIPAGTAASTFAPPSMYRVAPPPKKDNRVLMIVLIIVGFFVVMGITGVIGMVYVGHRLKQRVHEIQQQSRPTDSEYASSASARRVTNVCGLLSDSDVSKAIGIPIVYSIRRGSENCTYYAKGMASEFLAKKMEEGSQTSTTPAQQKQIQSIISSFSKNLGSDQSVSPNGQTPILIVNLSRQGGKFQMGLMKPIFSAMGPAARMAEIPGLGDEAITASDTLLLVRKGDAALMFTYNYLPDGTPKAEALAREILSQW